MARGDACTCSCRRFSFVWVEYLHMKKWQDFEPKMTGYVQPPPQKKLESKCNRCSIWWKAGWSIFISFSLNVKLFFAPCHRSNTYAFWEVTLLLFSKKSIPFTTNVLMTFQNTWMSTRVWPDRLESAFATAVIWVESSSSFCPGLAQNSLTSAYTWTRIWATY